MIIWYRNTSQIDHVTAQKWVDAYQRQIMEDFSPIWNCSALLRYIGDSQTEKPGPTDGVMTFAQSAGDEGALGYHSLTGQQPAGIIGIGDCIKDGVAPSSCGSHETLEMVLDPDASRAIQSGTLFLALEASDRVEDSDPDYKIDGVQLENFSLPAAFTNGPGPWDFRRKCTSNVVLPSGYQLQVDIGSGQWTQITGERARASKRAAGLGSRRGGRMLRAGAGPSSLILR